MENTMINPSLEESMLDPMENASVSKVKTIPKQ